ELAYWSSIDCGAGQIVPRPLDRSRDVMKTAGSLQLTLSREVSTQLLTSVPEAFRARINDVLLTGLAIAIARWRQRQGQNQTAVVIELEGHGREELFPGVNLSRTVGWFTNLYPVALDPGKAGLTNPARALKTIKEQLRQIPDQGMGYGLLRYLNDSTAAKLKSQPVPQIGFNYLGRIAGASW